MSDSHTVPSGQEVKDYLDRRFGQESSLLHKIRSQSREERLPEIHVSIYAGRLLYLLARIQKVRHILEIGTLGGYSTAWLAEALPADGRLITLEIDADRVAKARQHMQEVKEKNIQIRLGHAVDLLTQMVDAGEGPFDLIFIDADKENNALYLDWSLHMSSIR
jgi:predicted O-methyltransferase YrrM